MKGREPYVIVCDQIDAGDAPKTMAWQLASGVPLAVSSGEATLRGKRAALDVRMLAPSDAALHTKVTPAPIEKERTPYLQWRTPGPVRAATYVAVLEPRSIQSPKEVEGTAHPTLEGWVVEVRRSGGVDRVTFAAGGDGAVWRHRGADGTETVLRFGGAGG